MEVIRLSDKVPCLLELCAPCRLSIQLPFLQIRDGSDVSCQLCAIVARAQRYEQSKTLHSNWFMFVPTLLRRLFSPPSTRRKLRQKLGGEAIGDLNNIIFYAGHFERTMTSFEHLYMPLGEVSRPSPQPIVRLVPQKKIDISLAKQWLSRCENEHHKCHSMHGLSFEPRNELEIILVDVKNKKLVQSTSSYRYMALSYVWGKVPQLLLEESNLLALQEHMSLHKRWNKIPRVLRDAIHFVHEIGEQYLWIDTLCIIQDSDTRHDQIARMDDIYKGSSCTLVALDSKDASGCLPGVQPNTRSASRIAQISGLDISRRRPELAGILSQSTYEMRGWTFQERLLSSRCLYFTNEQLYFHCQTELWSEDKYEYFHQDADLFAHYPSLKWRSDSRYQTRLEKEKAYEDLASQYTKRRLSFQSDRLTAFFGITNSLVNEWGWEFLHGLPLQTFHLALMWDFSELPQKRIYAPKTNSNTPSWSWVAWTGGVHYQVAQTHSPGFSCHSTRPSILEIRPRNQNYRYQITKSGQAERIVSDAVDSEIIVNPNSGSLPDLLSFNSEYLPTSNFIFCQTAIGKGYDIHGRSDRRVFRILDSRFRSCGVLFRARIGTDLLSNNSRAQKGKFWLVLLGTAPRPLAYVLEESVSGFSIEDDDHEDVYNTYHAYYLKTAAGWGTCNVMLIEWRKDGKFAERVAIGQIQENAWKMADARVGNILLG